MAFSFGLVMTDIITVFRLINNMIYNVGPIDYYTMALHLSYHQLISMNHMRDYTRATPKVSLVGYFGETPNNLLDYTSI